MTHHCWYSTQQYLLSLQQYLDMRGATPHTRPKQNPSVSLTREIKTRNNKKQRIRKLYRVLLFDILVYSSLTKEYNVMKECQEDKRETSQVSQ